MRIVPLRAMVALLYMGCVVTLTALPGREVARWGFRGTVLDLMHIPLFTGLTLVTLWALVGPRMTRLVLVVTSIVIFAAADEVMQHWVPGRVASLADFARDALGIAIGIALAEGMRPLTVAWKRETER
jgi:VanZ family protein